MLYHYIISKNIKANEACSLAEKAPTEFISYARHSHSRRMYQSDDRSVASTIVNSPQSAICAPNVKFNYLPVL